MLYLITEISLYLLAAFISGLITGWLLRGLERSRYENSLQKELKKTQY